MIHEGLRPRDEENEYTRAVRGEENIDDDDLRRACKESRRIFEFKEMRKNSVFGPPIGMRGWGSQTQYHPRGISYPNLG